jgi:hypothetical protein
VTTDDPHWRRTATLSALLALAAVIATWLTRGLAHTALFVVAMVVALPALSMGAFAMLGLLLEAFAPSGPASERARKGAIERQRSRQRRARTVALVVLFLLGAAGATWYVLSPDVGSYQASVLLMLPILAVVLIWLYRRLPPRLGLALAIALAPIGPLGYLVLGGSQWWNWGQMTILPLVLLLGHRARSRVPSRDYDYRVPMDGPWGPP